MDLPNVVTVQGFKEFNSIQKEQLYETLLELRVAIEEIPKKSLRKILELSLTVLAYKGKQLHKFESLNERLTQENVQVKQQFKAIQDEKSLLNKTTKELHDEIVMLKERLQEVVSRADLTDNDSSDPLSELDKRETLLRNINAKNKHIKRLLKEIESLQNQNIEQTKNVNILEERLLDKENSYQNLRISFNQMEKEKNTLKIAFEDLNIEMKRFKGNMAYLENERLRSEKEMKKFIETLENEVQHWKKLLEENELELNNLKKKKSKYFTPETFEQRQESSPDQNFAAEMTKVIQERDRLIEQLENKIQTMAEEMVKTTELMNKVYEERTKQADSQKIRPCCQAIEKALGASNKRVQELADLLQQAEEESRLKCQEALNAVKALEDYQTGKDGLVPALKKCSSLERKLQAREKQINTLIMELNSLNETAQENRLLRKRLNIPDDVRIFTKNVAAKEKSKSKIIQHLNLKLRASEEMRLQLKMEKCDLRRQLLELKQILPEKKSIEVEPYDIETDSNEEHRKEEEEVEYNPIELDSITISTEANTTTQPNIISNDIDNTNSDHIKDRQSLSLSSRKEIEEMNDTFSMLESSKQIDDSSSERLKYMTVRLSSSSKEIGEIDDSNNTPQTSLLLDNICKRCQQEIQQELPNSQNQYDELIHENKLLRQGMLEILEKLREYNDTSDQIIIDNKILQNLLKVLQCQNISDESSPTHLRKQLQASKQREQALQELLREEMVKDIQSIDTYLNDVDEIREHGEIKDIDSDIPVLVDSTTRPTTPNRHSTSHIEIPEIFIDDSQSSLQRSQLQLQLQLQNEPAQRIENRKIEDNLAELKIYRKYYEELYLHMKSSESEIMQKCADLTEDLKSLEIEIAKERKKVLYFEDDLNQQLAEKKEERIAYIEKEMGWKIEIDNLKIEIDFIKGQFNHHRTIYCYTQDEFNHLQNSYEKCLSKLAFLTQQFLSRQNKDKDKNKEKDKDKDTDKDTDTDTDNNIIIPELSNNYSIIDDDNYPLNIITYQEYDKKENLLKDYHLEKLEMTRKISQLESLVELRQQQIQSQQKLLNDISDNHRSLRHLIADLQSTNEEKFLIAKLQRDITKAKAEIKCLENECQTAKENIQQLQQNLLKQEQLTKRLDEDFQYEYRQNFTKLRFLQKSLLLLKEKYAKYTPLILLTDYICTLETYEGIVKNMNFNRISNEIEKAIQTKFDDNTFDMSHMEEQQQQHLIKLIKRETQCKLFEEKIDVLEKRNYDLEKQLNSLRLDQAMESEHWQTIQALFDAENHLDNVTKKAKDNLKIVQEILTKDTACNTIKTGILTDQNVLTQTSPQKCLEKFSISRDQQTSINGDKMDNESINHGTKDVGIQASNEEGQIQIIKQNKAIQTLHDEKPASISSNGKELTKSDDVKEVMKKWHEAEQKYSQAMLTIQDLRENLKSKNLKDVEECVEGSLQANAFEKTVESLHVLLNEKDESINKYHDLLQSEREQSQLSLSKLNMENDNLTNRLTKLNAYIKDKDLEILDLKSQLEIACQRRNGNEKLQLATQITRNNIETMDDNVDNSLNEMTDEKIDELFQQEKASRTATSSIENLEYDDNKNMEKGANENRYDDYALPTNIIKQMRVLKEKASFWENNLKVKEEEIQILQEKLRLVQEREKAVKTNNSELKQLKQLLEEKEKHINELLDTLNNFHDDQERFINNTSNHSADQIAKLANDITRTEATNKIYRTQIEALKKQLAIVTQREKQQHELNISLRNQLIKRPVVSIKSELNARVKSENLQKRIQQLELDLEDAHVEIQRQKALLDNKRNRNNLEVGLWEKQKRWQQTAEKYKVKLDETEAALEKSRSLLQTARNTINRLEKDKQQLMAKLGKGSPRQSIKCCRIPSCPNLHQQSNAAIVKYTPSESPEETLTGTSTPCTGKSSPCHGSALMTNQNSCAVDLQHHMEVVEALRARMEMQQRKILTLEFRSKTTGDHNLNEDMNVIQEKLATVEAQNTRLEAKNLQLQLDIDMLRQGDSSERLTKRIKHLEDYIIALKEEMASMEEHKRNNTKLQTQTGQSAEHTILLLRNLVDKLKSENKYLRDGRNSSESKISSDSNSTDSVKLRQLYNEALEKIQTLQMELKTKYQDCELSHRKNETSGLKEELTYIKELLRRKSQLLQKAKVLLTRAAAKEKILKEQLTVWKRKCFELQNVPVIEEISE